MTRWTKAVGAIVAGLTMMLALNAGATEVEKGGPVIVDVPPESAAAPSAVIERGSPTVEIPPATASLSPEQDGSLVTGPQDGSAVTNQQAPSDDESRNLQPALPPSMVVPNLRSLNEFIDQMSATFPLGVELREDQSKLLSGESIKGLAVVGLTVGSPAAQAGVRPYQGRTHMVLEGVSMAASLFFPPAIIALSIVDQSRVGESFDLIIGVDGARVTNLLDFEDQMRAVKPGEIVYLNVVRDGGRLQIPVSLPAGATWFVN